MESRCKVQRGDFADWIPKYLNWWEAHTGNRSKRKCKWYASLLQDKINGDTLLRIVRETSYSHYLYQVIAAYDTWFRQYRTVELVFVKEFRIIIYSQGSPRELLLSDALLAIFLMKIERSALNCFHYIQGYLPTTGKGYCRTKRIFMN